jgi:hypothetical protein
MTQMEKPYYTMKTFYKPIVMDMPHSGKRYAISGSTWIEITAEVTAEMVTEAWTPLYFRKAEPKASQEKHYKVKSSRTGESYVVTDDGIGNWSCNCVGFGYYKKCKHIAQIKKEVLVAA